MSRMYVVKRNGTKEEVSFDKIHNRIKYLVKEPYNLPNVNASHIAQFVINGLYDGIPTTEIDTYSAKVSASLSIKNYDYNVLAGRIVVNNHHKNTLTSFKDKVDNLYLWTSKDGVKKSIVSNMFYKFVKKNQKKIEEYIDYNRDYLIDFYGFKTLEQSYLLKMDDQIIERPQDLYMRVAIGLHMNTKNTTTEVLKDIFNTYDLISQKYCTHATPTLFNCGLKNPALLSCFLLGSEDSLEGIMKTALDCARISKWSGGIGFHMSNWRGEGGYIRGTGGKSSGVVPFLKIFNDVARAVNQGGRRLGRFAVYIEPHHSDIMGFLSLRKNHGDENLRTRDLFMGMWISDLFMDRVQKNLKWSVFDSDKCPGLNEVFDDEYKKLYEDYEQKGLAEHTYNAREIWHAIFMSQKESGIPYLCYKDTVNRNSNQKNIGVIKSSNLCSEIMEYSSSTEYACCSLASVCLSALTEDSYTPEELDLSENTRRDLNHDFPENAVFNYEKMMHIVETLVRNLNKVIDYNHYPVIEAKVSNYRHRPIGIGVQGLSDVYFKFDTPFDSDFSRVLNKRIFETLYFAAVTASNKICIEEYEQYYKECQEKSKVVIPQYVFNGTKITTKKTTYDKPEDIPTTITAYSTFEHNGGSPLSKGIFHFEMMGKTTKDLETDYDWETLRENVVKYGVKNSLLISLMPTVSTSRIMGNIECIEPITSNIYKNQTLAGEFIYVNKYLINDLNKLNLWNDTIENKIKLYNGSIQNIVEIPEKIRRKYRTNWEMSQKVVIDQAADRQPFVDQAMSLNLYIEDLTFSKFNSMSFYSWKKNLKTGCYYLRSRAAVSAQKVTVDMEKVDSETLNKQVGVGNEGVVGMHGECESCSA